MAEKAKEVKKEEFFIELENFRIVKADALNWGVDQKNDKGEWKGLSSRSYYNSISLMLLGIFETDLLTNGELKSFKKLRKQIKETRDELKTIVKDLVNTSQ